MKVMLIGGGGREHALAWKIAASPLLERLLVTHDNPGFPPDAVRVGSAASSTAIVAAALDAGVDLVVVGPEAPLAAGIVDDLAAAGIPALGPSRRAAQLEASKAFAKAFLDAHGIPTARWSVHDSAAPARAAVTGPCVVKADGLAAGKGVVVADSAAEAIAAIDAAFAGQWGGAGARVVVEERLSGPELSVIALCDGERAVALLPCRDHKRRFDGDKGPNTGGMGAICPAPGADAALLARIQAEVLDPTVAGMAAAGTPFRGVLYAGLMLTASGPKVLEFNVRFGDPECEPLMLMAGEDLLPWFHAAAAGKLPDRPLRWRDGAACCVVMVADGYPGAARAGDAIEGIPAPTDDCVAFVAGARREGDAVVTAGGRVLAVTAWGPDAAAARARAYAATRQIHFEGASWREDIGATDGGQA